MPSQADAATLLCPKAPPKAASAMPNAAAIASVPLPLTAPASCANAAGANSATDASAPSTSLLSSLLPP